MVNMDPRRGASTRNTSFYPGSATVHKGEPGATEIAKLQFSLTPDEDERIDDVLKESLERYKQLSKNKVQRDEHITTVSKLMRDKGWETPLTEVYHAHEDVPDSPGSRTRRRNPTQSNRRFRSSRSAQFDLGPLGSV